MKTFLAVLSLSFFFTLQALGHETLFYVDSNARQNQTDGSIKKPFHSIEELMSHIKSFRKKETRKELTVFFRKGVYPFSKGYELDETYRDITFCAYPNEKVIFSGGVSIPLKMIQTDINQHSTVNLKHLHLKNYGDIRSVGFARPSHNSWMELFINGKPMHLSRWPNKGLIPMGKIIEPGSVPRKNDFSRKGAVMTYDSARISSWTFTNDMWMAGYFHHGYADDALRIARIDRKARTITTDGPTLYGFNSTHPWNQWYAFNIKEEVDEKNEFFVDKQLHTLHFISPDSLIKEAVLSQLEEPFFSIHKSSNIVIQDIIFEYTRAVCLSLTNSSRIQIKGCTFRNSGQWAVTIGYGIAPFKEYLHEGTGMPLKGIIGSLDQHLYANQTFNRQGGTDNLIEKCHFYHLGAGAISLGGGNRLTLEQGNNTISHCTFHDNNRIERSYRPHIYITGVGNKIVGCELYNAPSMAILLHGNNHLIENNSIHHVVLEADDQGALYYGRNPSECGTVVRNNTFAYIPNTYSTCAIYQDDGAGGLLVENNLFYKAGRYGALIGGGSDNRYVNNTFIDMPIGIHIDNRLENWSSALVKPNGLFQKRLEEVSYNKGVYADAYPYLKNYLPYKEVNPQRNEIANNQFINVINVSDRPDLLLLENNQLLNSKVE